MVKIRAHDQVNNLHVPYPVPCSVSTREACSSRCLMDDELPALDKVVIVVGSKRDPSCIWDCERKWRGYVTSSTTSPNWASTTHPTTTMSSSFTRYATVAVVVAATACATPLSTSPIYSSRRTGFAVAPLIAAEHPHGSVNNSYIVMFKVWTDCN